MNDNVSNVNRPKRAYRAPELIRIPLRAEEAVLGGCKTAGVVGARQGNCTVPANCRQPKS